MKKYMITGAQGQLGTELSKLLHEKMLSFQGYGSTDLDITNRNLVFEKVNKLRPDVIFHCAAYTAVDDAEDIGKKTNWKINVDGTKNIIDASKKYKAILVYISTDYVFDGTNKGEYQTEDPTNPRNEYGKAKLAGENEVKMLLDTYYIIRTSWLFGKYGKNFVYTMLDLAKTHETLKVVNDQIGRPTWTRTLAEFMLYLVQTESKFGTYQLSNDNVCSWFEFANKILKNTHTKILPITSDEYPQKAYRPRHSIMSLDKARNINFKIPSWQDALDSFIKDIK